ncbi:oligopeptide transporter 4-like [Gossypium australe]|uniref:Oligopeptide transporter 4-like n=1 Tax=Gossypium australe TaxID=47621 RepID=A0A5B6WQ46_9ROSI|nr:oligopeptide transporter 4-like [Gossypium australe]
MDQQMLREYTLPILDAMRGSIERSTINANNFEIKATTIQMIQNTLQFKENMVEDPNQYLKWFLQLCDTIKYNRVSDDLVRLQLFPFSLCNNANDWIDSLKPSSIIMWNDLTKKFLYNLGEKSPTLNNLKVNPCTRPENTSKQFVHAMDCKHGSRSKFSITVLTATSNPA